MAYFAPYIDATGLHIPTYDDIYNYILTQYCSIYGVTLSTNLSTSDIQDITNRALMINDCMNGLQLAYNGFMVGSAVGAQQDTLYKLNGISRNSPTYSTASLSITGLAGATLTNLVAQDQNGNLWTLPASFTLSGGGTATVTGTCQTVGAIAAPANTITIEQTPTANWYSVNNAAAAIPGAPVEPDSGFRARQAVSVANPSQSLVTGTLGDIAQVDGVTRYATGIPTPGGAPGTSIENPSGSTDSWGNPAHSITMVVEGATDLAVATAIYLNKTPGALTNGSTTVSVTDPTTGVNNNISLYRPTYISIYVSLTVEPLAGYTSATTDAIQAALVAYLNDLQIGENVTISALYAAAMSVMPTILLPLFSITALTAGTAPSPGGTTDIAIGYYSVSQTVSGNIVITT
jgi:uncharacterized phage protein gp47/JayE